MSMSVIPKSVAGQSRVVIQNHTRESVYFKVVTTDSEEEMRHSLFTDTICRGQLAAADILSDNASSIVSSISLERQKDSKLGILLFDNPLLEGKPKAQVCIANHKVDEGSIERAEFRVHAGGHIVTRRYAAEFNPRDLSPLAKKLRGASPITEQLFSGGAEESKEEG